MIGVTYFNIHIIARPGVGEIRDQLVVSGPIVGAGRDGLLVWWRRRRKIAGALRHNAHVVCGSQRLPNNCDLPARAHSRVGLIRLGPKEGAASPTLTGNTCK